MAGNDGVLKMFTPFRLKVEVEEKKRRRKNGNFCCDLISGDNVVHK